MSDQNLTELQRLVDQVALFHLFAGPDSGASGAGIHANSSSEGIVGFDTCETLHRFDIKLDLPSKQSGVRADNILGERIGQLELCWMMIPPDFMANPSVEPPPTIFNASRSQRFVMQKMIFKMGERDGFNSFGTGRTFPTMVNGVPRLIAAAVGNINEGFGKFQRHEGNFTLCGELTPERGFMGHIIVRVIDEDGSLRTKEDLPPLKPQPDLEPDVTYLAWAAQKVEGMNLENRPSFSADGQIRGLNIPVALKHAVVGLPAVDSRGFRCNELQVGEVIGLEIGFGRAAQPDPTVPGTALNPFRFEGVARYSFHDRERRDVGAITTNVLEGRRFDMKLAAAPEQPALRFGFFGPMVYGSGCFEGAEGFFYGATGSILQIVPPLHVITHLYVARLFDPTGRFRAGRNGKPQTEFRK